ncbi:M3 family oligoendopeptidase [Paenibacillus monticola]|uniref:Oligoendopeptidase F n=1 Tax=Paenibacillus monticola TaxID=2666075 RepID=A0A7X2L032_9BACL|nr:M3 family oligoendopeptidase [Paenibacillus monticola]MRN51640.1 oligoendopeptidase F [Paenibacillus monticola]
MNMTWNLDTLYPSFESPKLRADRELLDQHSRALNQWTKSKLANTQGPTAAIEAFLRLYNQYKSVYVCLLAYAELILSADSDNKEAMNLADDIEQVNSEIAGTIAGFKLWLAGCENVDKFIGSSPYLLEHRFYLQELLAQSRHVLSEEVEVAIASMQSTGSKAWERLYMERASTVRTSISIEGDPKQFTLSELRSMAYESKAELRLAAYTAEIEAYEQIAPVCAASINGISGEALTIYGMRGYSSALEKVLVASRMDNETLEAMLVALKESLPSFHTYYRTKAELLGHQDALPFYDIFAPIGEETAQATYTEAKDIIISSFTTFSAELAEFAEKVFEQRWIDAEPRAGKGGFGLCIDIFPIQESRIMTHFTGTSLDISVLAHEIGHAYHSSCLSHETMLNTDYPTPIAETASIFCETLVNQALISSASGKEALPILERSISDAGYYLVDFYARYLFELQLFTRRASGPLSVQELNELMHSCMVEAYGESIDETTLHAYMWMNKAGYFMAGNEFLNFPYSFGLLFSKGLYAEYLKKGEEFFTQYRLFLSATSKNNIVDAASIMGVDVHSIDFWRNALQLIKTDIAEFISKA